MTTPKITVVTTVRNEPDWFVADLQRNVGWADDFLALTVPPDGPWLDEGEQNAAKRAMLWDSGADWTLWMDPDERLELGAGAAVRQAARSGRWLADTVYGFHLCEMWTPTAYRVDGVWGRKQPRMRLFRLRARGTQAFSTRPIHAPPFPRGARRNLVTLDVNLYHLKCIEAANRAERARAYLDADPAFRYQRPLVAGDGWDWLSDETGLQLREMEPGREFAPPYTRPYVFVAPR